MTTSVVCTVCHTYMPCFMIIKKYFGVAISYPFFVGKRGSTTPFQSLEAALPISIMS